jgi:hypothetical protein
MSIPRIIAFHSLKQAAIEFSDAELDTHSASRSSYGIFACTPKEMAVLFFCVTRSLDGRWTMAPSTTGRIVNSFFIYMTTAGSLLAEKFLAPFFASAAKQSSQTSV